MSDEDASISIHAPHTRGDRAPHDTHTVVIISIHAPHTRGDTNPREYISTRFYFNPRPSYEGRLAHLHELNESASFQSTPLIRGATSRMPSMSRLNSISIHAPHTRGDETGRHCESPRERFQSTPLIRGATQRFELPRLAGNISIHAPHTRGDFYWNVVSDEQR